MRTSIILAITIFSSLCMALPPSGGRPVRPGEKPRAARASETSALDAVKSLNRTLSEAIETNARYDIAEAAKKMSEKELDTLAEGAKRLNDDIKTNRARFNESGAKIQLDSMIEAHNAALNTRATFSESTKTAKNESSGPGEAAGKLIVETIDNGFSIIRSKVNETAELAVSEGLIVMTFRTIAEAVNKTSLSAKEMIQLKETLEKPFAANGITLEEVARCR